MNHTNESQEHHEPQHPFTPSQAEGIGNWQPGAQSVGGQKGGTGRTGRENGGVGGREQGEKKRKEKKRKEWRRGAAEKELMRQKHMVCLPRWEKNMSPHHNNTRVPLFLRGLLKSMANRFFIPATVYFFLSKQSLYVIVIFCNQTFS